MSLMKQQAIQLWIKVITIVSQLIIFIVLARSLSIEDYANYILLVSITGIAVHFIFPGITNLQVKLYSNDTKNTKEILGYSVFLVSVLGLILSFLLSVVCASWLSIPFEICLLFFISEIMLMRLLDTEVSSKQGKSKIIEAMLMMSYPYWLRSVFIFSAFLMGIEVELQTIVAMIVSSTVISVIFTLSSVFDIRIKPIKGFFRELKDFSWVGLSIISKNSYLHSDKLIINHYYGEKPVSEYAISLRLVMLFLLPIQNYLFAIYPKLFSKAEINFSKAISVSVAYAIASGVVIYFIGDKIVIFLLGDKYSGVGEYMSVLAPFPLVLTLSSFLADFATSRGYYKNRALIQFALAMVNLALNMVFIPIYGPMSAVVVTLFCEIVMISSFIYLLRLGQRL